MLSSKVSVVSAPISLTNELALQVVDVSVCVKKILLLVVTFNLDSFKSLPGQVFWVVNINKVLFFSVFSFFSSLVLKGQ
jgi:hypothetical protein